MNFTIPTRWAVLLLALLVSGPVARGVRDLSEYSTHARELEDATAKNAQCAAESASLSVRIEAKLAVAAEYAAGRLTLRAAARRFLTLSDDENGLRTLRRMWPNAADDEERCAASVVQYIRTRDEQPNTPEFRRVVAEFEREYGSPLAWQTVP